MKASTHTPNMIQTPPKQHKTLTTDPNSFVYAPDHTSHFSKARRRGSSPNYYNVLHLRTFWGPAEDKILATFSIRVCLQSSQIMERVLLAGIGSWSIQHLVGHKINNHGYIYKSGASLCRPSVQGHNLLHLMDSVCSCRLALLPMSEALHMGCFQILESHYSYSHVCLWLQQFFLHFFF